MKIEYHFEEVKPFRWKKSDWHDWLLQVAGAEGFEVSQINYIFCSDEYLLQINRDHLGHDYFTDIITFDLSETEGLLEAEIFISIERVKEHATDYGVRFEHELARVMVHGLLHLCGYDDHTDEDVKVMRTLEDQYISISPVAGLK